MLTAKEDKSLEEAADCDTLFEWLVIRAGDESWYGPESDRLQDQ